MTIDIHSHPASPSTKYSDFVPSQKLARALPRFPGPNGSETKALSSQSSGAISSADTAAYDTGERERKSDPLWTELTRSASVTTMEQPFSVSPYIGEFFCVSALILGRS